MSSYLVAFIVSNFDRVKKISPKYGVEIEVAARPDAIRNGDSDFALDLATDVIDFFSDYYNISYALKKSSIFSENYKT